MGWIAQREIVRRHRMAADRESDRNQPDMKRLLRRRIGCPLLVARLAWTRRISIPEFFRAEVSGAHGLATTSNRPSHHEATSNDQDERHDNDGDHDCWTDFLFHASDLRHQLVASYQVPQYLWLMFGGMY